MTNGEKYKIIKSNKNMATVGSEEYEEGGGMEGCIYLKK